jgi:hypothetical protein
MFFQIALKTMLYYLYKHVLTFIYWLNSSKLDYKLARELS